MDVNDKEKTLDLDHLSGTINRLKAYKWTCVSNPKKSEYDYHKFSQNKTVEKYRTVYRDTIIILSVMDKMYAIDVIFPDDTDIVYSVPEKYLKVNFISKHLAELYETISENESDILTDKLNDLFDIGKIS